MKISDSARVIIVNERSLYSRKSILPLTLGILIGICLAKEFIVPSLWNIKQIKHDSQHNHLITTTESVETSIDIDTSVTDRLYREVRVLCWVMTNSTNHESRAQWIKKTWGPRCNKLLFMSDEVNDELGSIDLNVGYGRDVLWAKTKEAFKYVYYNHFDEADWFLKADDDTYVILENLRYLLYAYNSGDPIYFGCKLKQYVTQGYMSGGAGYVLSKEALNRFVEIGLDDVDECTNDSNNPEDVQMGKCLENIGVIAGDSRDSKGRRRFFPFGPDDHYINLEPLEDFWYSKYSFYNISEGLNCCSNYPISFHYVEPNQMHFIDYAVYHIRPFGITYKSEQLPVKISIVNEENSSVSDDTSSTKSTTK